MKYIIIFFLSKANLNYMLFAFLFILGLLSYSSIPKDIYPPIKIQKIHISGAYAGASIDTLNKMAVTKLEKDFKGLHGAKKEASF